MRDEMRNEFKSGERKKKMWDEVIRKMRGGIR